MDVWAPHWVTQLWAASRSETATRPGYLISRRTLLSIQLFKAFDMSANQAVFFRIESDFYCFQVGFRAKRCCWNVIKQKVCLVSFDAWLGNCKWHFTFSTFPNDLDNRLSFVAMIFDNYFRLENWTSQSHNSQDCNKALTFSGLTKDFAFLFDKIEIKNLLWNLVAIARDLRLLQHTVTCKKGSCQNDASVTRLQRNFHWDKSNELWLLPTLSRHSPRTFTEMNIRRTSCLQEINVATASYVICDRRIRWAWQAKFCLSSTVARFCFRFVSVETVKSKKKKQTFKLFMKRIYTWKKIRSRSK